MLQHVDVFCSYSRSNFNTNTTATEVARAADHERSEDAEFPASPVFL
jgi:hypothetical protein